MKKEKEEVVINENVDKQIVLHGFQNANAML